MRYSQRVSRIERLLPEALDRRLKRRAALEPRLRNLARNHAIAVAAMVLNGELSVTEPLLQTWTRTFKEHFSKFFDFYRYFGHIEDLQAEIEEKPQPGYVKMIDGLEWRELQRPSSRCMGYAAAAESMIKAVMGDAQQAEEEAARFSEVFRRAPPWLLKFTFTFLDAEILNFDLPNLAAAPEFGEIELRHAMRWPLLPLGALGEGALVTAQPVDPQLSTEDCALLLEILGKPEVPWTRVERDRALLRIGSFITKGRELKPYELDFREYITELPRQEYLEMPTDVPDGNIIGIMFQWSEALTEIARTLQENPDLHERLMSLREQMNS